MLGLLHSKEDDKEEDIEKIIENARVANYSFVKGSYSFSKGTVNLGEKD